MPAVLRAVSSRLRVPLADGETFGGHRKLKPTARGDRRVLAAAAGDGGVGEVAAGVMDRLRRVG